VPLVSIIIPHYNRSKLLKETVDSVIRQTNTDWEIVIVDDGSDEHEMASLTGLAETDKRINLLQRRSRHKGPSACRNEGAAVSRGSLLIFLDSDDLLAAFCIEQRVMVMELYKDLDMGIFLMQEFFVEPGDCEKIYNHDSTYDNRIDCFLKGENPWAVTCPVWRKDFFTRIGGFDDSFFFMEDPELHIRALSQEGIKYKTFYEHPADCYYRTRGSDHSNKFFYENSIRYRIKFFKKTGNLITGNSELLKRYKKSFEQGVIQFFQYNLVYRVREFPGLHEEFMEWAKKSILLSKITILKLQFLSSIYRSDNRFFRKMHLRGLAFKILLPKL
jgi:glycosyltransferase involved in cell wall biosynthesis